MDHLFQKRGLSGAASLCAVLLFGLLASLYSPLASAATYATWQQAQSACQAAAAELLAGPSNNDGWNCIFQDRTPSPGPGFLLQKYSVGYTFYWAATKPPANPCSVLPSARIYNQGNILQGSSICARTPDPVSGGTVQCALTFTPISPPTQNQNSGGWETYGTLAPSGNLCGGTEGDPWKDGNGGAMNPAPPVPTLPAVDVPAPPQICGGGSCYDPKSDQYCATAGGQQFCVSGSTARASPGACITSGDAALCAGSPDAPKPPADKIPDPATQIKAVDKTTQANKQTGQSQTVTTAVYAMPSTPTTSGQQAGDRGPAPASSTGNASSYGGGGDCNTPPACTGDAVMCGVARQTWKSGCDAKTGLDQLHKDLAGDGSPSDFDALKSKYSQGDVWADGDGSTGSTVGDAANAGNYDTSGFGIGTSCPLRPLHVPLWQGKSIDIPLDNVCMVGDWIRGVVIAFALFAAARITAGSRE